MEDTSPFNGTIGANDTTGANEAIGANFANGIIFTIDTAKRNHNQIFLVDFKFGGRYMDGHYLCGLNYDHFGINCPYSI